MVFTKPLVDIHMGGRCWKLTLVHSKTNFPCKKKGLGVGGGGGDG